MSGVENISSFLLAPNGAAESNPPVPNASQSQSGFRETLAARVESGGANSPPPKPTGKPENKPSAPVERKSPDSSAKPVGNNARSEKTSQPEEKSAPTNVAVPVKTEKQPDTEETPDGSETTAVIPAVVPQVVSPIETPVPQELPVNLKEADVFDVTAEQPPETEPESLGNEEGEAEGEVDQQPRGLKDNARVPDKPPAGLAARLNREQIPSKPAAQPATDAPSAPKSGLPVETAEVVTETRIPPLPVPVPAAETTTVLPPQAVADTVPTAQDIPVTATENEEAPQQKSPELQPSVPQGKEEINVEAVVAADAPDADVIEPEQLEDAAKPKTEKVAERPPTARPRGLKFRGEAAEQPRQSAPVAAIPQDSIAEPADANSQNVGDAETPPLPVPEFSREVATPGETAEISLRQTRARPVEQNGQQAPVPTHAVGNPTQPITGNSPAAHTNPPVIVAPSKLEEVTSTNPVKPVDPPAVAIEQTAAPVTNGGGDAAAGIEFNQETFRTSHTQTLERVGPTAPTGSPQHAAKVDPQPLLAQVESSLLESNAIPRHVRVQLQPSELGSLRLDVTQDGARLTARIETDTAATHKLLAEHLPQLKESLAQQGLELDRIDLHLTSGNDGSGTSQQFQQQQDDSPETPTPEIRNQQRFGRSNPLRNAPTTAHAKLDRLDITI